MDKQVEFWRKNGVFWKIVDCHVDVYGCSMPQIEKLLGGRITKDNLPKKLLITFNRQQQGGVDYLDLKEAEQTLEFFDFVVSTSFYQSEAKKFARDKKGGVGYVLIMNDVKHRNCSKKLKKTADCFINHEEYLEEFEVPYVGYVLPEELDGFIVDDLKVSRSKKKIRLF